MKLFESATATPHAGWIKIDAEKKVAVAFGDINTGALIGDPYDVLAWLARATANVHDLLDQDGEQP